MLDDMTPIVVFSPFSVLPVVDDSSLQGANRNEAMHLMMVKAVYAYRCIWA